jgi:excisionase family DNA binding protein
MKKMQKPGKPADFYRSVKELAADLGMSERSAYEGLRRRQIPHRRVGGKYLLHRPTIQAWLLSAATAMATPVGETAA